MRRLLCACAAVALIAPSQASAQNFPEIPDNHWAYAALAPLTPRAVELTNILFDAGLIERRNLRSWGGNGGALQAVGMYSELQNHMSLLRVYLGVVERSSAESENSWLNGWHRHLPVLEELFKEVLGDRYTSVESNRGIKEDIRVIKERFAARGMPVDENRFRDFSDVPDGHWAQSAIKRMRERGILYGYPDGSYRG